MTLAAECLAATTGLWPRKNEPTANDRLAANGLLDRWRSKLAKWLRRPEEVAPFDWKEPPDEAELRERILRPIEAHEEEQLISLSGDVDLGREYVAVLRDGRDFLNSKWPKIPVPGLDGLSFEMFPASSEDIADVWNLTRILDDSDALMDEIAAYSVVVPMIDAWKTVYPALSAAVIDMLDSPKDGLLVEHHAAGRTLSPQQEDVLKMLIGRQRDKAEPAKDQKKEQTKKAEAGPSKAIEHATRADFKP